MLNRLKTYNGDKNVTDNLIFANFYLQIAPMYRNGKSAASAPIDEQLMATLAEQSGGLGAEAEAIFQAINKSFKNHPISRPQHNTQQNLQNNTAVKVLNNFALYPNPSNGNATLAYELSGKVAALWQLYDVNGRLLIHRSLAVGVQQQQLDLSALSNGVYHFSVTLREERLQSGKLIIAKH